ncbi:hypothetical protein AAMO2058_001290400 [Amorphochlora amoebiformis]
MNSRHVALAFLLQLSLLPVSAFNLTVGVLLTSSGSDVNTVGTRAWRAKETYNITQIFAEAVRTRGAASGASSLKNISFVYVDVGTGSTDQTNIESKRMCNGTYGKVDFIISPFSSGATQRAAVSCLDEDHIMISGGAASEAVYSCLISNQDTAGCTDKVIGQRRFGNLFGVIPLSSQYMEPVVQLTKLAGANSIAFFHTTGLFETTMCENALTEASFFGFEKVYPLYEVTDQNDDGYWNTLLNNLENDKPDVVVGCVLSAACQTFVEKAFQANYLPKFLALSVCVGSTGSETALGDKLNFIAGPVLWDSRCTTANCDESRASIVRFYNQDSGVIAPMEFSHAYENFTSFTPSYQAAGSMAALYALTYAIERSQTNQTALLREALNDISQPSFYGLLEGSRLGANREKQMLLLQYDDVTKAEIVFPLSSDTMSVIYPIPTWDERTYKRVMLSKPLEKIMVGIVCMNCVILLGIILIMIINRNHSVIKAVSPTFVIISLLGLIFVNFSLLTWGLENNAATCGLRPWIIGLGFTLFAAPITVKLYRIKHIFETVTKPQKSSVLRVSDAVFLRYLGVLLGITILLLVIWQTADPLTERINTPDLIRPSKNFTTCNSKTNAFPIMMLVYFLLLLASMVVLSFQTRKSWAKFKETQQMAFAIYSVIICVIVSIALTSAGQGSREYSLAIRLSFITIATWTWCIALYAQKMYLLLVKGDETESILMISSLKSPVSPQRKRMSVASSPQRNDSSYMTSPIRLKETKDVETNGKMIAELEARLEVSEKETRAAQRKIKSLEEEIIKLVNEKVEALALADQSMRKLQSMENISRTFSKMDLEHSRKNSRTPSKGKISRKSTENHIPESTVNHKVSTVEEKNESVESPEAGKKSETPKV